MSRANAEVRRGRPNGAFSFLHDALCAPASAEQITAVSIPAPVAPVSRFARLAGENELFLWQPRQGVSRAASGAVELVTMSQANSLSELRRSCAAVLARVRSVGYESLVVTPVLVGGLAFCGGRDHESAWRPFGDGFFLLPRWQYGVDGGRASLTFFAAGSTTSADAEKVVAQAVQLIAALEAPEPDVPRALPSRREIRHLPVDQWRMLVEQALGEIAAGHFEKVVLARRSIVAADREFSSVELFAHLCAANPDCFCFAFAREGSIFAGASPERLLRRVGRDVCADALAGTGAVSGAVSGGGATSLGVSAQALLASEKNRREQRFVVQAIAEVLGPLCSVLSIPDEPEVRPLGHLQHLSSNITGRLSADLHILDLVAALHPTPAVGGLPAATALAWLRTHEPEERGWYAGPVGWFDAAGDGEFAVAIRSGLVRGNRAWVYAGSGIVADSDPAGEYAETALKQRAMLQALGMQA